MVPWMSGLVSGLQNRVRRFESARNLTKPFQMFSERVFLLLITKMFHFQSIWIQLLQFSPIEVFFIFALMPPYFSSIPLFIVLSAVRASMIAEWGQAFALILRIRYFWFNPLIDNDISAFCTSASTSLLILISHSVLAGQSVTRIKKQVVNHYQRSTDSDCPIYCGKVFPHIMGICSHKMRESFPS